MMKVQQGCEYVYGGENFDNMILKCTANISTYLEVTGIKTLYFWCKDKYREQ